MNERRELAHRCSGFPWPFAFRLRPLPECFKGSCGAGSSMRADAAGVLSTMIRDVSDRLGIGTAETSPTVARQASRKAVGGIWRERPRPAAPHRLASDGAWHRGRFRGVVEQCPRLRGVGGRQLRRRASLTMEPPALAYPGAVDKPRDRSIGSSSSGAVCLGAPNSTCSADASFSSRIRRTQR